MKHGLTHNRLWKQLLFHQTAAMMYSLFEYKTTCAISLGWNKPDVSVSQDKSHNRVTTCNRNLPVTRSKDFLMVNNRGFNNACRTMNNNIIRTLISLTKKKRYWINKIRILLQSFIKISVAYLAKKKNYLII